MAATATIQVTKVYPPRNNNPRASWSVVDGDGSYWGFYPDKVQKPAVGSTITVEWKGRSWNGKEYKDIIAILGTSGDTGPTAPRAAAPANGNGSSYRKTDPDDAIRMWVCSIVNAGIQAGKIDPFSDGDIEAAGKAAKEAHAHLFGSAG